MARRVSGFLAGTVIFCVALTAFGARGAYGDDPGVFNVLSYGAKGDGQSDDSGAFLKAWEAACKGDKAGQTPTLVVPADKSFLVHPLQFLGPCKSSAIKFQVLGKIIAPTKIEDWQNCRSRSWIYFSEITNLTVDGRGSGVIDGRGQVWWSRAKHSHLLSHDNDNDNDNGNDNDNACKTSPKGMTFYRMENLEVSGLTSVDSPRAHIRIQNCTSAKLTSLLIEAPDESPNTDGIAIGASSHIQIHDSTIGTGDDCISIKGGTAFIDITGITCGPGHGISIGSLGYGGAYDTVEEVNVRNCTIKSAQNGVRIKTWEGGSGYVRGIHFEDIVISDAKNPIIIDQNYCDNQKRSCKMASPVVKVSDVTYRNVRGTSWKEPSITLMCAGGTGCTNIVLDRINLDSSKPGEKSYAECKNVVNATFTSVDPPVSCQTS